MVLVVAVTRVGVAAFVADERAAVQAPPPPTTTNAMTAPIIVCRIVKACGLRRTVVPSVSARWVSSQDEKVSPAAGTTVSENCEPAVHCLQFENS